MRVFIAEKPDLAKVIADALGGGLRKGGFIECGPDIVTWCIGHLLALAPPEVHNPAYAKWNANDLPMKLRPQKYMPIDAGQVAGKAVLHRRKEKACAYSAGIGVRRGTA